MIYEVAEALDLGKLVPTYTADWGAADLFFRYLGTYLVGTLQRSGSAYPAIDPSVLCVQGGGLAFVNKW